MNNNNNKEAPVGNNASVLEAGSPIPTNPVADGTSPAEDRATGDSIQPRRMFANEEGDDYEAAAVDPEDESLGDEEEAGYLKCRDPLVILDIGHVLEEQQEVLDCDSASDASELNELDGTMEACLNDRIMVMYAAGDDVDETVLETEKNMVLFKKGLEKETKIPKPPDDWVEPAPNVEAKEPAFLNVDNPGNWHRYYFRPKFAERKTKQNEKGEYLYHQLPTGARVVPEVQGTIKRCVGDWEFFTESG